MISGNFTEVSEDTDSGARGELELVNFLCIPLLVYIFIVPYTEKRVHGRMSR